MSAKKIQSTETTETDDQRTTALQPVAPPQLSVTMEQRFQEIIEYLKNKEDIKNDLGVVIQHDDKIELIKWVEKAYPTIQNMVQTIHEVSALLYDVRQALKPLGLFVAWLDVTGFPRRTAYNYLKLQDTFKDELPNYSHLGMKRLMAATTLKDGIAFVKKHEQELSRKPVVEVEAWIKDEKRKNKKGKGGRKPTFQPIGRFKLRTSTDGTKVMVENLDDDTRKKLLAAINEVLSQVN